MKYKILISDWTDGIGWGKHKIVDDVDEYDRYMLQYYIHDEWEKLNERGRVMLEVWETDNVNGEECGKDREMIIYPEFDIRDELNKYKQLKEFINSQDWRFAKTYQNLPHAYLVRNKVKNDLMFDQLVVFIRQHGWRFYFGKMFNTYLEIGDKYYWTMGSCIDKTTIINRANLEDYEIKPKWKKKEKKMATQSQIDFVTGGVTD